MKTNPTRYRGDRFPPEIISHGVWVYHRFCLSFRDVEELLVKRGISVSYEAGRQWWLKGQGSVPWRLVTDKLKSYDVAHGVILNFFRFSRHRMGAKNYRWLRARAFKDWDSATAA